MSTTSGTTTVQSATAAFVSGDVGQLIRIWDCGPNGNTWLDTTVASVVDATHATLATAASVAIAANASFRIGLYDTDITLEGGFWYRGTAASGSPA